MKKTIALGAAALIALAGCTDEPEAEAPEPTTSSVETTTPTIPQPLGPTVPESTPEETTEPLPVPPDSYICGDPSLYELGTTFYFDGTTGWTQECSDLMRSQYVPPTYDEAPPSVPAEPYYESSGEAQFDHGCAAGYIDPAICNAG